MSSTSTLLLYLTLFFAINFLLSTTNKLVLDACPTPWLLTCLHATCTSVGCLISLRGRDIQTRKLEMGQQAKLLAFSVLFTINIATSNISLLHVSLAFHQVARSIGPIFTVAIYRLWYKKVYSMPVYLAVSATTIGIGLATYADYSCTLLGVCVTFAGMLLATVKTIATNRLMVGDLHLSPLEALLRMCPLVALQSFAYAYGSGEFEIVKALCPMTLASTNIMQLIVLDTILAFAQNVSSFHTNKAAGALTLAVCANLKQLFTIIVAIRLFETPPTLLGGLGISVVLAGAMSYSWIVIGEQTSEADQRRSGTLHADEKQAE